MLLIVITKLVRSYPELNDLFILLIITNIQKNKKKKKNASWASQGRGDLNK